ncbi:nuclear factor of activated T-cells, putative [Ixodes scapularis]|uniref:Nuclear factor of activated T-cells, putative n=1 Tax=Ixodes scapularis TaxID=6945 RepID=B7QHC8_IXOSC|nr:nuclear factor of activated T-cells, putative [Ixodes scapularis]|eukprot:XP_002414585.1 nuclear factor of activated T-cells, putative [Ixodes scapularis]
MGGLLPVGVVSSAPKAEQHASLPGPPVNLERVPLYQEQLELSYPELNSLSSALADRYHRMESNMSTLDCTSDTTNLHEDSVSSTVRETNQDTSSLVQEPNSMLVRMLHMTVKEDHSWLGALSAGNPASSVSSPSSSRASLSPPPHSPRRGGTLGGASPLAVSEEATLGDTLACAEPPDAPSTSRAAAPDFHNLQTALRALIKEVTQASPQESHCSQGSSICGATRSLLSADSTTGRPSGGVFASPVSMVAKGGIARRVNQVAKRPTLYMSFPSRSRRGDVELKILSQPEEQHRARYLTEGSRGAVKDRTGMGFPTVKLVGLQEQVKLQVFIGTDQGKVQPHMFYQASRVCGKNSTPCQERRLDGTTVLEVDMLPAKDMTVRWGFLAYRNLEVAHMVLVHLVVTSGGRASEPHPFTYVPLSAQATLNLLVSPTPSQNLVKVAAEDLQALESCHLKRKISHAPDLQGAPEKCALSYEQTVEESMKAAEEPLASLGLFYQGGGANATMMTPCTVEQMMVALPEGPSTARSVQQTSFDCESQWNALAAAAQQSQQETQAKPLWSQLTSCEPPPTEPELETCVGEHGSVDTSTVPFTDEQQFKKQKVKDAPVLSLQVGLGTRWSKCRAWTSVASSLRPPTGQPH